MKKLLVRAIASFCVFSAGTCSYAETAALEAGEYIAEGGWGTLAVKQSNGAGFDFQLNAIGANGHTCDLSGKIRNSRAVLKEPGEDKPCKVDFAPAKSGIRVVSGSDECRTYCGMRAGFEGLYLKPAAGCESSARIETGKRFKSLYDQKNYADARATLEPMLDKCRKTLHSSELGSVRNDLAITMYKLQDFAGCLRMLAPYAADAKLSDDAIRESLPPFDADLMLETLRAARTNLKLCRAGGQKK
jgi:hypothetical protein